MRYKGYTLVVTMPKDSDGRYRHPVFTVIGGGTFGNVVHQGTIYESFSAVARARAAALAAARKWVDESARVSA